MTRSWVDQAKKSGQAAGSGGPDGTFAAGVARVTELLPVLMNDIVNTAPEDQKVRPNHDFVTINFFLLVVSVLGTDVLSRCLLQHRLTCVLPI